MRAGSPNLTTNWWVGRSFTARRPLAQANDNYAGSLYRFVSVHAKAIAVLNKSAHYDVLSTTFALTKPGVSASNGYPSSI